MNYIIRDLRRDYPYQPITDFAKARNWFVNQLKDGEYVLFVSDHEEVPKVFLDYLSKLEPKYPYYNVRVMEFVNGKLVPGSDPGYRTNLISNRARFVGAIHEHAVPKFAGGTVDYPMLHSSDGSHSYSSWQPKWYSTSLFRIFRRSIMNFWGIVWDELGHGLFRSTKRRKNY